MDGVRLESRKLLSRVACFLRLTSTQRQVQCCGGGAQIVFHELFAREWFPISNEIIPLVCAVLPLSIEPDPAGSGIMLDQHRNAVEFVIRDGQSF